MPKSAGGVSAHSTIVRRRQNPRTLASRHPSFQTRLTMAPTNIGPAPERHSFPAAYPREADKVFRIASVRDAAKPGRTVRESSVLARRAAGDARQRPSAPYESRRLSQAISGPRFRPSRREGASQRPISGRLTRPERGLSPFAVLLGVSAPHGQGFGPALWFDPQLSGDRKSSIRPGLSCFEMSFDRRGTCTRKAVLAACLGEQSKVPR